MCCAVSASLALLATVVMYDRVKVRREAAPAEDDVGIFQTLIVNPRLLLLLPPERHVARDDRVLEEQVGGPGCALHVHAEVDRHVQLTNGLAKVVGTPRFRVAREQLSLMYARGLSAFRGV